MTKNYLMILKRKTQNFKLNFVLSKIHEKNERKTKERKQHVFLPAIVANCNGTFITYLCFSTITTCNKSNLLFHSYFLQNKYMGETDVLHFGE
jgi:hypothetical protein